MLERTNLDKQLLKVISRNANVFTNQEKEICNLELVEFSNFSWKAANILNKLFKGVKTKLIKDEEKLIKGKIINRKALYFVLKKENITLATSINQLLQGYEYQIYKSQKFNKSGNLVKYNLYILVDQDGHKKGIEIVVK